MSEDEMEQIRSFLRKSRSLGVYGQEIGASTNGFDFTRTLRSQRQPQPPPPPPPPPPKKDK